MQTVFTMHSKFILYLRKAAEVSGLFRNVKTGGAWGTFEMYIFKSVQNLA